MDIGDDHYDGRVFLYALASWNDADPADYLAAGWWLIYPPNVSIRAFESATRGVFLDGPELDPANPPDYLSQARPPMSWDGRPVHIQLWTAWGELAESTEVTEFSGPVALIADFDQTASSGASGVWSRLKRYPAAISLRPCLGGQTIQRRCQPTTMCASKPRLALTAPSRIPPSPCPSRPHHVSSAGTWQGQFSNVPDVDGSPGVWSARPMCCSLKTMARMDDYGHLRCADTSDGHTARAVGAEPEPGTMRHRRAGIPQPPDCAHSRWKLSYRAGSTNRVGMLSNRRGGLRYGGAKQVSADSGWPVNGTPGTEGACPRSAHWLYGSGNRVLLQPAFNVEMDTWTVENVIRRSAKHARNALVAGSDNGARCWARYAFLLGTCKLKAVTPRHTSP